MPAVADKSADRQISIPARAIAAVQATGKFEVLLPECYRPMAQRFLSRAELYIATCKNAEKIQKCTVQSLAKAILVGAEYGIAIDGRMGHIVPYGDQATFMPDYKGLVAVGRRHGAFVDAYARIVCENDVFDFGMEDATFHVRYKPNLRDRGEVIGAYALLLFEAGRFVVEWMDEPQIESVRQRSKAKDNGPWVTDWAEMAKKTVLRRAIKTYSDDPEMLSLIDHDDFASGIIEGELPPPKKPARSVESITRLMAPAPPAPEHGPHSDDIDQTPPESPQDASQEPPGLLDGLEGRVNAQTSRGDLEILRKFLLGECQTDAEREAVNAACDKRRGEIKPKG